MINLSSFIRFHAQATPNRIALTYDGDDICYRELFDRIRKFAAYLQALGIRPGDVVAVLMKNSPAFLEIAFAVSHLGAVFLPINFRLHAEEVDYICGNSDARLLIADIDFANRQTQLQTIFCDDALQRSTRSLTEKYLPAAMQALEPQDLFRLMYTSGTTGHPKGVMHSYDNFYWKSYEHSIVLNLNATTRLLIAGPLYHVGAFDLPGIAVLQHGGMLAIVRDFDAAAVLALIEQQKLDSAWLAPVMTRLILDCETRDSFDVASMRWVVGGGEKTPEQLIHEFSEYFTNARYIDAYGLTESCSGDTFMEAGREIEKVGSTGRATPHVALEIRDEQGKVLAATQTGEICLRGPKIFKAYWKDPEKTAESFFGDWFRTGDVGHLDEEGFLYLTDRKKDLIISGGENIASSEVERVIMQIPNVAETAVVGRPDDQWGEVPVAVVVCKKGTSVNLEMIVSHCRKNLAAFKVPVQLIVTDELPRNPSGKVLKRLLREALTT